MAHNARRLILSTTTASDVFQKFSTDIYAGNNGLQSVVNGLNLLGSGGLVWVKRRSASGGHFLVDSERALNSTLSTDTPNPAATKAYTFSLNADGWSVNTSNADVNTAGGSSTYVGWSFKKDDRFFDIVTYTGNDVAGRAIPHNLGAAPGMIVIKELTNSSDWKVYHRGNTVPVAAANSALELNRPVAVEQQVYFWNNTAPTDSAFFVGEYTGGPIVDETNETGVNYIAYLFAHDETPSGSIRCGSYTGNGSTTGPVVDLGWEPQWLMIKSGNASGNWQIFDNVRSTTNPRSNSLAVNESTAEQTTINVDFNADGFQIKSTNADVNTTAVNYTYVAIRAED